MLSSLHIRNYVLIGSLDIDFPAGLVIISGPTGAGKSILIGALGLLCGSKADASVISDGAESCVIEGEFRVSDSGVRRLCDENDIDYDGGFLIIRRMVAASGRSRAFVNDSPVTLPVLASFGSLLVDIHSQHDTLLLTNRSYQLSALDSYAGNEALLAECGDVFQTLHQAQKRASELRERIEGMQRESDYNMAVYSQLKDAALREGEIPELEEEQRCLANSGRIKELLSAAVELCNPSTEERSGLNSDMMSLSRAVDALSEYIGDFKELAARVETVRIELKDICSDISDKDSSMGCDPDRLQWIDDRLNLLYGLLKRHNCESEAQLIAKRDELATYVEGGGELLEQLACLEKEISSLSKKHIELSDKLHSSRLKAAEGFSGEILSSLSYMELDSAKFEISLEKAAAGPCGYDDAEFLFSGGGSRPAPIAKCASGGELSRIMLSLKALMSKHMNMPTMVFDEIDTGVSGSVADKMGSVICRMGESMQVFAITHLPQVAAKGSAHYLVEKTVEDGKASSTIKKLSREERVLEVARMLSASELTPESLANAKALLG